MTEQQIITVATIAVLSMLAGGILTGMTIFFVTAHKNIQDELRAKDGEDKERTEYGKREE